MAKIFNLVLTHKTKTLKKLLCTSILMFGGMIIVSLLGISEVGAVPITHRVTIQPIQVRDDNGENPANINRQLYELETDKIWAQAGIDISFLSNNWTTLDVGRLQSIKRIDDPNAIDGTELFTNLQNNGASNDPTVINMWFVDEIVNLESPDSTTYGLGNGSSKSVIISDSVFDNNRIDSIAHEIGHALGLDHTNIDDDPNNDDDPENLLTRGRYRLTPSNLDDLTPTGNLDKLTKEQIDIVMRSSAVKPIPVPSAWILFTTGSFLMGGLASLRRKNIQIVLG